MHSRAAIEAGAVGPDPEGVDGWCNRATADIALAIFGPIATRLEVEKVAALACGRAATEPSGDDEADEADRRDLAIGDLASALAARFGPGRGDDVAWRALARWVVDDDFWAPFARLIR